VGIEEEGVCELDIIFVWGNSDCDAVEDSVVGPRYNLDRGGCGCCWLGGFDFLAGYCYYCRGRVTIGISLSFCHFVVELEISLMLERKTRPSSSSSENCCWGCGLAWRSGDILCHFVFAFAIAFLSKHLNLISSKCSQQLMNFDRETTCTGSRIFDIIPSQDSPARRTELMR
jgi:hypothetical protein